jgi:hypothetical protein
VALNRHVLYVVVFQIAGGFHFHKTPKVFLATLQDIRFDDYALMFKGTLENGRNLGIRD